MHSHIGYTTHLTEVTAKMLAEISEVNTSGCAERLHKELIAKAKDLKMIENGNNYLSARHRHTFWQKCYQNLLHLSREICTSF